MSLQIQRDGGRIEWMQPNSLFIAGTDTGVGKTLITALVALRLRAMGIDCGVMKPFASGCFREGGALVSEDAAFLIESLELDESQDEICPIRLEEPLAPLIAARRAGISTRDWPEIARGAFESLQSRHECVIVEGVGGLLAPIWEDEAVFTNRELIELWGLPTLLVARRSLGTINHTLLSLNLKLEAPAYFAGLVFNDPVPVEERDVAASTNPDFIAQIAGVPVWGQVPFSGDMARDNLMRSAMNITIPPSSG